MRIQSEDGPALSQTGDAVGGEPPLQQHLVCMFACCSWRARHFAWRPGKSRRRSRLTEPADLHERSPAFVVGMVSGLVKGKDRSETRVGTLKLGTPLGLRFRRK